MNARLCAVTVGTILAIVVLLNAIVIFSGGYLHQEHVGRLEDHRRYYALNTTLQSLLTELHLLKLNGSRFMGHDSTLNAPGAMSSSEGIGIAMSSAERENGDPEIGFTKRLRPNNTLIRSQSAGESKRVVIFTMDSISSYEKNSLSGGAAGELAVRKSLEYSLTVLGCTVTTVASDEEFSGLDLRTFDFIIVDPWTWAARGWVPKPNLVGQGDRVYVLDFFGNKSGLRLPNKASVPLKDRLTVPLHRFLTAFGSPHNTFLGYIARNHTADATVLRAAKKQQGVIWGKDAKHFAGSEGIIKAIAGDVPLVSTATTPVFQQSGIKWRGHQTPQSWLRLLGESRFLVGLGNPLLGPSAIDAISVGCMFLNPVYAKPVSHNGLEYTSQHPYAEKVGPPYVCNYAQYNERQLRRCIDIALHSQLPPWIPTEFSEEAHIARVKRIFNL